MTTSRREVLGTAGLLAAPSVLPTAAAQSAANDRGTHPLGDLALQSGKVLPKAQLSWRTHGTLSPGRDNVVLYPTSYSAQHPDLEWLIGPDGVLDPGRWFIVIPDMFGNGLSSSPSNTEAYPDLVTAWDNVQAQRRMLRDRWGIERIACAYGWSMGAIQAYHWAAAFPTRWTASWSTAAARARRSTTGCSSSG
jgi:homoserine O-acetyltransferase